MIRAGLEFSVFVGLALAVHFGAWWRVPSGDLGSSGNQGAAAISLSAVSPSVAAMVEALDQPPEVDTALEAPAEPQQVAPRQPEVPQVTAPAEPKPVPSDRGHRARTAGTHDAGGQPAVL